MHHTKCNCEDIGVFVEASLFGGATTLDGEVCYNTNDPVDFLQLVPWDSKDLPCISVVSVICADPSAIFCYCSVDTSVADGVIVRQGKSSFGKMPSASEIVSAKFLSWRMTVGYTTADSGADVAGVSFVLRKWGANCRG